MYFYYQFKGTIFLRNYFTYQQVTFRQFAAAPCARCVAAARRSSATLHRASPWPARYCGRCCAACCGWPPLRAAGRMRGCGRPWPLQTAAPPVAGSLQRTGISTPHSRPVRMLPPTDSDPGAYHKLLKEYYFKHFIFIYNTLTFQTSIYV